MSRYRDTSFQTSTEFAYRDAPPQRWDSDRFAREREREVRRVPVYDDYRPAPIRPVAPVAPVAPVYERDRYYEEDRYGGAGQRTERRYYEDDYYRDDPRAAAGVVVPLRSERAEPPVRPGQLIRRQSSLDTFDRRVPVRQDYYYEPSRPSPRPFPAPAARRVDAYYDEVKVQEPDLYGDEGFREIREREWIRRRRRSSGSRSRSRSRERISESFDEVKEEKVERREEKPYPRKGKTRMPKRLVHTKVLFDLGYPFYEEDEKTILILKALGPENIDQVFAMSKEYREQEVLTTTTTTTSSATRLVEVPPEISAPPPPPSVREERIVEKTELKAGPISETARSVQEWDDGGLKVRSPSPRSHRSHRSRSRRASRRRRSSVGRETVVQKTVIERDVSPAPTHRTVRTSRSSLNDDETVIEKTKIITTNEDLGESNSVHVGPLALVVDHRPSRSDRDIKDEIRRLEAERRELRERRRSRRAERDDEYIRVERVVARSPSPSPPPRGEVVIERRGDDLLEIKRDRRVRANSAAPGPRIVKAMMTTLT